MWEGTGNQFPDLWGKGVTDERVRLIRGGEHQDFLGTKAVPPVSALFDGSFHSLP